MAAKNMEVSEIRPKEYICITKCFHLRKLYEKGERVVFTDPNDANDHFEALTYENIKKYDPKEMSDAYIASGVQPFDTPRLKR